ncbi:MAG: amino acid carrier protein [Treponema sp.]|jgi:AGCS family alanine or glycine:cation symporter|nr:amino acid carrier protein [Treponema sp.]
MENFLAVVGAISGFLWNRLFLVVLVGGGIYLTIRLKFFQVRYFPYIIKQTFGKILDKGKGEGSVSPFKATATALASTIGASNIIGVPVAIAYGGPGALFWMWVIFLVGCATKFSEAVLGVYYRVKNADGYYVGGPGYYMTQGFPIKKVGKIMARITVFVSMIYYFPSIAMQSVSLIQNTSALGINQYVSAAILTVLVGVVVIGGLKRVAQVAGKMVPTMCILYLAGALIVVIANIKNIPSSLALVFGSAFTGTAAVGGFMGAGVSMAIRMGMARATYSCEAGMGSAGIAHAATITDHPVRQGFWAVFEVIVDGTVCTLSGILVLASGVWKDIAPSVATTMPAAAFQKVMGPVGGYIVTISITLFVLSTIIAIIWYAEKMVEFGLTTKISKAARIIYTLSIMLGALSGLETVYVVLDLANAFIILPNILTVLILSPLVAKLSKEFFSGEQFYLENIKK